MTSDEVVAIFSRAGGVRGDTCESIPQGLDFRECCGSRTADYNCHEYIARGPNGGNHYLSHNLNADNNGITLITYGTKGYHYRNSTSPCI